MSWFISGRRYEPASAHDALDPFYLSLFKVEGSASLPEEGVLNFTQVPSVARHREHRTKSCSCALLGILKQCCSAIGTLQLAVETVRSHCPSPPL